MARGYKALRVPIALLHQKVYPTSARMEAWKPLDEPKTALIRVDASRVISPGGAKDNLFTVQPHLRRFFFLVDGAFRVTCRRCLEVCASIDDRNDHTKCYYAISETLKSLARQHQCLICEVELPQRWTIDTFNGVPVCSQTCLSTWDNMNPDLFDLELLDVVAAIEKNDRQFTRR
jgi:hypothetical protein